MGPRAHGARVSKRRICCEEVNMSTLDTYTSLLVVLSLALLLIAAGLGKKQLEWRPRPLPVRRRPKR
jgi:hypothetical protein